MKLHLMKAIIYFTAIVLLCIGFSACDKESDLIENSETFFEYQSKHEVHLSNVIELLKEKNDSIPFIQEFKNLYGRAMWDENITVENSDGYVILVPILSNDKANLNGIWMFNHYESLMNYGVIVNDEEVRRNLQLDYTFAYFEQELLGLNEKYEFENLTTKDENSLTKGGYMVEYCYIIKTIMNGVEMINPNPYCTNIWVPSADTNKYFLQDWGDGGVGSGSDDGGGSSGTGNPTPDPDPIPEILPTPEFKAAKTGCAYKRLMLETSFMQNLLKDFVPTNSNLHIKLEVGYIPMKNGRFVDGRTYSTRHHSNNNPNTILIKINEQTLNQSLLKVATVVAHELIHAEIFRWIEEGNWKESAIEESYPDFFNDFLTSGKKLDVAQHEYMTKKYVTDLTLLLQWFDRGRHSAAEYNAMAWSGLDKTIAFINTQNATEISNLQTIIKNEETDCDDI